MGEKKVTEMILEVNLQCDRCYKKVQKVLCKFPEIQNRIFNEKSNTVTITVICCDPEKIKCRLCRKGRGSIKSIDIKDPAVMPPKPVKTLPETPPKASKPEHGRLKPVTLFGWDPIPTCCEQCYGGLAGGPCNYGYGALPVYYEGYYNGRIGFNVYGPNRGCHPGRCAEYFCEENPAGCSVM